jgi:hypothetical protein
MKLLLYYLAGEKGRDMSDALPSADGVSHILHLLHATVTDGNKPLYLVFVGVFFLNILDCFYSS